jgi:hypothetical protein
MSSPGYVILEADTGAAGLSICKSRRIDCVVSGLDLPDEWANRRALIQQLDFGCGGTQLEHNKEFQVSVVD